MAEREFRTTPQWPIATTPLSGDELVEVWKGGKQYYVPFSELGGMPAAHSGTHKHGGDDEVGTLDNLAYEIPKLDADGLIDSRVSDASTTTKGKVQLATDGEEDATKPPTSTDSRLKDARPPTAHAAQHIAGTDVIADATVSNSGLMSAADKVKADATIPANIPTADQKAALVGSYGTPSAANRFVTKSDPVLSSIGGGGGGTTGPDLLGIGMLGTGLSISGGVGATAILAALNSTDVALIDHINKELRTYRFNGSTWSQEGTSLSISGVGYPALASLSSTDVAFIDGGNKELITYRFNGSTWAQVGTSFSISNANSPALTSLSSTDVAFIDAYNGELRTYRFNGSTWSQEGTSLSISGVGYPALASLSSTDVAFIDAYNGELRTYRFNGSTWSQEGTSLSISNVAVPALAALNSTDVAFIDHGNKELITYRFNGSTWAQEGTSLSISGASYPALASLSSTDVAFIDAYNGELRTYNFLFGYDSASVNIVADYEVPEIATGKSIVIRRTSAYDGNPVTITPPSGATFEGLSSLSLYDQYSFVELERISSTVFAIKNEPFVGPVDCTSRVAEYTGDGIPLIPDKVAGRTYFRDEWATTDGWGGTNATISVSSGYLNVSETSTLARINRTISIPATNAKTVRISITRLSGVDKAIQLRNASLSTVYATAMMGALGVQSNIDFLTNASWTGTLSDIAVFFPDSTSASSYKIETIYIGTGAYDTPALDRAGNGNNLTLNAVTQVNGKYGKEMSFNGSTSYAQASSPVIGTTGTVAVRFKRGSIGTTQRMVNNASAGSNGLYLQFSASNILRLIFSNGTSLVGYGTKTYTNISEYNTVIFNSSGLVFYDGILSTDTVPSTWVAGLKNLLLGTEGTSEYFNGIISHFRYDSRIWTADEARAWSLNPISIDSRV